MAGISGIMAEESSAIGTEHKALSESILVRQNHNTLESVRDNDANDAQFTHCHIDASNINATL